MELPTLKRRTLQHLQDHTDLNPKAAEALVVAICDAAQTDFLNAISGSEPYPSSMSDLRALRLRYICEAAQRLLTTQEVAIVFRITSSAAQTLLQRMEVLYPVAVDRYLDALVVKSAGKAENAGEAGDYRYRIRFTQRDAWEHAIAMLQRAGCSDIRPRASTLTIEPLRKVGTGKAQRNICDILGIPRPK